MPKNIAEEKLKEKLAYIGLNLEKLPKFLKEYEKFSFHPTKSYDETSYKVYQYIKVTDIQILLTPTDRLTNLNEKYQLAKPIASYLDSKSEENVEQFATFLKILNDVTLEEIKQIEKEQEEFQKHIPYEVKYAGNFMWQIYYSDISNQYFMLVPTNEQNNAALFYLLKKQIESMKTKKEQFIFVPISHMEYSGKYLTKSQIADMENYLWYFTKEWPSTYEVYHLENSMTLKLVGKTNIYEKMQSEYVISLENKEQALEQYKLLKALFILSTGLPEDYQFQAKINKQGALDFYFSENTKLEYQNLSEFISKEALMRLKKIQETEAQILQVEKSLQSLKNMIEKQNEEYLEKQRQIATFLACKKSFFGKIRYYFSTTRKKQLVKEQESRVRSKKAEIVEKKDDIEIVYEEKEQYTIEDVIGIGTKLEQKVKKLKNLNLDVKALELKKENFARKIKNANIYLNEIELHKKSIFEFWKFTNKDELPSLEEGEEEETTKEKIGKTFSYEEDFEDLGKQMDILQRRKLSKNETDAIFAAMHALKSMQILNHTKSKNLAGQQLETLEKELEKLQKEYEKDSDLIKQKDFDIFGGMLEDQTKIKEINNIKHREIEKDKYKVLNITSQTELSIYIDNLRNYLKLLKEAFHKVNTSSNLALYFATTENLEMQNLNLFNLDLTQEMEETIKSKRANQKIKLYRINLQENMPLLYYTNIIFYDNFNRTLPEGMNLSSKVLINLNDYQLKEINTKKFNINYLKNNYQNKVEEIILTEYEVELKK